MRLLLLDIETAPHIAAVWGLWDQNITLDRLHKPGYTLCWSAKWHGEKEIHFDSILSGHKSMIRGIHRLIGKADALCHYNGTKFDIPILNQEFMKVGLAPPSPSRQIDLLQTARRRFRLASNKLEFVASTLGLGSKVKHKGFELWQQCMAKDREAFKQMEEYNKQDVVLLEKLYDRLLPWIEHHPNRSVMGDTFCCPKCGSKSYQQRGIATQITGRYRRYQCKDCSSWFRLNIREPSQRTKALAV